MRNRIFMHGKMKIIKKKKKATKPQASSTPYKRKSNSRLLNLQFTPSHMTYLNCTFFFFFMTRISALL